MSRSINRQDRDLFEEDSQNRGGEPESFSELIQIINGAAAGRPTMVEFVERLQERSVEVIPSMQSSGRLNGFAFRWKGQTVKGSTLGREYTAKGLQQRKGVSYEPQRDDDALIRVAERAGLRRPDRADYGARQERNPTAGRVSRMRDRESGLSADQKATVARSEDFAP